jgi:aryl-alcohol dehydrogenase-like predicted oxidoreductase/enamine deaminase RidA (YjgF/YER057c/UK114 family)
MNELNTSCELAPGLHVSRVITGLWQVADLERNGKLLDPDQAALSMKAYYDAGLTTFDMADHYGSAEIIAGVFQKNYGKPQLFTKWVPSPGVITKEEVRVAVQKALKRLQLEQIDLMQFHAWNYAHPSWLDCLFWLDELKDEGLIAHLGLTNFDSAHVNLVATSGIRVVSNQVCYSLLDQRAAHHMTEVCLKHNIKLLAFGTVAGGFLTEKWLDQPEPIINESLTWSQMKYKRFINEAGGWLKFQSLLRILTEISKQYHTSIASISSRYILDQPAVAGVIIGARLGQREHIQENKELLSLSLDAESKNKIRHALAELKSIPGDCGDEYRKPPFLTASGDLSHHLESMPAPYPTKQGNDYRLKAMSGTIWEDLAGFSRAVKKGNLILVSGTTATHGMKLIGGQDPAAQMHFVIDKIEGAIQSLGGKLEDVVRTRIYIKNISDWEAIARAHGERFHNIQPANTMIKADLIGDEYLVEMEAEALLSA